MSQARLGEGGVRCGLCGLLLLLRGLHSHLSSGLGVSSASATSSASPAYRFPGFPRRQSAAQQLKFSAR
eukprot:6995841-Alexandrium_andersonii.AAC.1